SDRPCHPRDGIRLGPPRRAAHARVDWSQNAESQTMTARERVERLTKAFPRVYPNAHCELDFRNPLELLVATILSAQCTDKRVNAVTPALFAKYRTAADYAKAPPATLEK